MPEILGSKLSLHEASYQEDLQVSLLMRDGVKGVSAGEGKMGGGISFAFGDRLVRPAVVEPAIWTGTRKVRGGRPSHQHEASYPEDLEVSLMLMGSFNREFCLVILKEEGRVCAFGGQFLRPAVLEPAVWAGTQKVRGGGHSYQHNFDDKL